MGIDGSGGKARDGGEDFVGSFLPGKGFRGLIVRANKIRDGINENRRRFSNLPRRIFARLQRIDALIIAQPQGISYSGVRFRVRTRDSTVQR